MSLYTMDCGLLFVKDAEVYDERLKGVDRALANPCYLIRHGSDYLLWDVGLMDALAPYGRLVGPPVQPGEPEVKSKIYVMLSRTLASQLATLHLRPDNIRFVSVAGFPFDHTGNIGLFKHSTLLIDDKEYSVWQSPRFRDVMKSQYSVFYFADSDGEVAARKMHKVLIPHSESYDVFGDGSVVIYPAPGHTPGQRVLLIRMPQSGNFLITGDVYDMSELRKFQLEGVPFDGVPDSADLEETVKSQAAVERLAKETEAKVILPHEFSDFFAMPAFPDALH